MNYQVDHKTALEAVVEIEKRFDVNSLYYGNMRVWPLIRLTLYGQLLHGDEENKVKTRSSKPSRVIRFIKVPVMVPKIVFIFLRNYWFHRKQLGYLYRKGPFDILFFSRQQEHREIINGKSYNPQLDPLIEPLENRYKCLKVELKTPLSDFSSLRSRETVFINQPYLRLKILLEKFWFRKNIHNDIIAGFDKFQEVVFDVTGRVKMDQKDLLDQIERLKLYKKYFSRILLAVRPTAVFLSCYYYITAMALISACKEAGVKTIDVQHGKQGKYHASYTHWTQVPEKGYEFIPDYFWVWGIETRHNILSCMPKKSPHRAVIGGNRWLAKWISEEVDVTKSVSQDFLKILGSHKRVILVSLQPIQKPVSKKLLDAIKHSPKSWIWLLRLHPLMQARIKEIKCVVTDIISDNARFEIENANSLSLYSLLKLVDYHVTGWSTVCYEALAFKVHTVIISPTGKNLYQDYISQGLFSYAETGTDIIDIINKDKSIYNYKEKQPYMETSDLVVSQAFREIMGE